MQLDRGDVFCLIPDISNAPRSWHNDGWTNRAQLGRNALGIFWGTRFFIRKPVFAVAPHNRIMRGVRSGDMQFFHNGMLAQISAAYTVPFDDPQKAAVDKGFHGDLEIIR